MYITKLTHCLPYSTVVGEWGTPHQIQLLIQTFPLGHKFIKYHFNLVWSIPVLIINLEDYICYTFSPFSFVLLAVTDTSLLFWIVLSQIWNHVLSNVNEDGLQFLVWTISIIIVTFSTADFTTIQYFCIQNIQN